MRGIKVWLVTAAVLMVGGIALSAIGLSRGATWNMRFDLTKFKIIIGSDDYVTETLDVDEFNKLIVNTDTIDVNIIKGDKYSITYHVPEDQKPEITNNDKTLSVSTKESEGFTLFNFSFFFSKENNPYINITIPDSEDCKVLSLATSTGDIKVSDLTVDGSINTSTGDIILNNNKMGNMVFEVSTGDIYINNCTMKSLETNASTGEVNISDSTCNGKYYSRTSTGDVIINNSELDSFNLEGSTSDVNVKNTRINNITISTSTGDISMILKGEEKEYSFDIDTSTGDIEIGQDEFEDRYSKHTDGNKQISISTSTGDIEIDFSK